MKHFSVEHWFLGHCSKQDDLLITCSLPLFIVKQTIIIIPHFVREAKIIMTCRIICDCYIISKCCWSCIKLNKSMDPIVSIGLLQSSFLVPVDICDKARVTVACRKRQLNKPTVCINTKLCFLWLVLHVIHTVKCFSGTTWPVLCWCTNNKVSLLNRLVFDSSLSCQSCIIYSVCW